MNVSADWTWRFDMANLNKYEAKGLLHASKKEFSSIQLYHI